ncbi:hypothetical protein [Paenibacillus gallinarum]|uniref:hypothetical protein n=1 Tax=Paenibacillus gallinarum TaxID=2762232 RepID=UPI001786E4F3|nr:hypothetical protein [Paenibacillus gallinarum]
MAGYTLVDTWKWEKGVLLAHSFHKIGILENISALNAYAPYYIKLKASIETVSSIKNSCFKSKEVYLRVRKIKIWRDRN